MSIALLELALDTLGPLAEEVVFVGGATIQLHVVEPGGTNLRPTVDVDIVVRAATRVAYEGFAERLRGRGISEDSTSRVICRWRQVDPPLILDVMPTNGRVFGFGNRWYDHLFAHPATSTMPSGRRLRHSSASALVATKLEAYSDRGARDPLVSHDLEDIIRVFDSRPSIVQEIDSAPSELRAFITEGLRSILDVPIARAAIPGLMLPDQVSQERARTVVLARMRQVVAG